MGKHKEYPYAFPFLCSEELCNSVVNAVNNHARKGILETKRGYGWPRKTTERDDHQLCQMSKVDARQRAFSLDWLE